MSTDVNRFEPLKSKSASNKGDIYDGKYHDVTCKINDIYDWVKSKGDDFMMTIRVTDKSSNRLFLKIFNSEPIQFDIKINDNVIVRNVKFFRKDLFIVKNPAKIDLIEENTDTQFYKRETLEIKDICSKKYIDFSGFVIHKQKELPNLAIVYMIDYTRNSRIENKINRGRYSNDMVLHVKIWDYQRFSWNDIVVGGCYKFENLKVQIEGNSIYGHLSFKEESKFERIRDTKILEMFEERKKGYSDDSNKFYNKIHKDINSISSAGYHKVKIKILGHTPLNGFNVLGCKKCSASSLDSHYEICECPDSNKIRMQVLKLLGEDESGKQVFLCKNDICQIAVERLEMKVDLWECLVFTRKMEEGLVHEIRDIM